MTDPDFAQRAVLGMLFELHPAMRSVEELQAMLSDVPRVDEAVTHLASDGVVVRLGELVGLSRAAVRTDQLAV